MSAHNPRPRIPRLATVVAVASLMVPVGVTFGVPGGGAGAGALLWLLALVPAFVLSYYRGWQGASMALAAGMVAVSASNFAVVSLGAVAPDWGLLLGVVTAYVSLTLGIGWLSDGLHSDRDEAQRMAMTDALTGLANRRFAERVLEQSFALAGRGMPLAVVMFDVDHFKGYNDRQGHVAGDQVLRVIGRLLERAGRRSDFSCRYGGEEFLCILHNCQDEGALAFVERVRSGLVRAELPGGGVTVSAGVAVYKFGLGSPEDLVAAADEALYAAKAAGRDCTRVASPSVPTQSPEEAEAAARALRVVDGWL